LPRPKEGRDGKDRRKSEFSIGNASTTFLKSLNRPLSRPHLRKKSTTRGLDPPLQLLELKKALYESLWRSVRLAPAIQARNRKPEKFQCRSSVLALEFDEPTPLLDRCRNKTLVYLSAEPSAKRLELFPVPISTFDAWNSWKRPLFFSPLENQPPSHLRFSSGQDIGLYKNASETRSSYGFQRSSSSSSVRDIAPSFWPGC